MYCPLKSDKDIDDENSSKDRKYTLTVRFALWTNFSEVLSLNLSRQRIKYETFTCIYRSHIELPQNADIYNYTTLQIIRILTELTIRLLDKHQRWDLIVRFTCFPNPSPLHFIPPPRILPKNPIQNIQNHKNHPRITMGRSRLTFAVQCVMTSKLLGQPISSPPPPLPNIYMYRKIYYQDVYMRVSSIVLCRQRQIV